MTDVKLKPAYDPDTYIKPQINTSKYAPVRTRDTQLMAPLTFASGQVFNSLRITSTKLKGGGDFSGPARSRCVLHKGW